MESEPTFSPNHDYPGKGTFSPIALTDAKLAERAYHKSHAARKSQKAQDAVREANEAQARANVLLEQEAEVNRRWLQLGREYSEIDRRRGNAASMRGVIVSSISEFEARFTGSIGTDDQTAWGYCVKVTTHKAALPLFDSELANLASQAESKSAEIRKFAEENGFPEGAFPRAE